MAIIIVNLHGGRRSDRPSSPSEAEKTNDGHAVRYEQRRDRVSRTIVHVDQF